MDRTKFYKVKKVNGFDELDFLDHSLSGFKQKKRFALYRVAQTDLLRPDMISYKNYGTVRFWWFLLFVSGIEDPFNDILEGQMMNIPNHLDLYDFFREFKQR